IRHCKNGRKYMEAYLKSNLDQILHT
ncbi:unnamed protein product, partial [Allacma fusca]